MGLQQNIIRKFMRNMNHTFNSNVTALMDASVLSCQSNYATIQQVIDDCVNKLSTSSSYDDFLKTYCGIILDNVDTGAITGSDAIGEAEKSADSIVQESDISDLKMPTEQEEIIAGLKIKYPAFSSLSTEETFIVSALHTWWIEKALDLDYDSFGFSFNDVDATPKEMEVKFYSGSVGELANVTWYYSPSSYATTGQCIQLDLNINMTMYGSIDVTKPNGETIYGTTVLPYLDRTIAHEFVHAIQAANIAYFPDLEIQYKWFTEGSAELAHGIDDKRRTNIIDITSNPTRFASAFTSSPVTDEDVYSAGYILLRFFAKQVALFYAKIEAEKRHLMVEKGNVKTLKEVGEKFIEFAQKSRFGVQPWELVDDRLSSFYGATLRVPMRNWEDKASKEDYYVFGNSFMTKHGGSTYPNFIDKIKNRYQDINVIEDYSLGGLDAVDTRISSISSIEENSHIIFNGCEANISAGDTAPTVISKINTIVNNCETLKAEPTLFITPNSSMYSDGNLVEAYKILLRSSFVTNKVTVVCLGDSLTDYNTEGTNVYSWTETLQADRPDINVVNKGVGGDQTSHAIARFQTDIIDQCPDICILLIGGNNMWFADYTGVATAKTQYKQMVDDCIAHGIVPVIGTYKLKLEQIEQFVASYGDSTWKTPLEILLNFNEFLKYCEELASQYKLKTFSVYHDCIDSNGYFDFSNVLPDKIHPSKKGAETIGHYIAKQISDVIEDEIETFNNKNLKIVNVYDIFCKNLGLDELPLSALDSMMCSEKLHYSDGEPLDCISDYVLINGILKPLNCPYFYVSLQHINVYSNTYADWLRNGIILDEYIAHDHDNNDEYSDWHTGIYYQSEKYNHSVNLPTSTRHVFGKYGGQDTENAFKNTGEFIAVGLHTLFDKDLWMCEQGGITCEKEAKAQINDLNLLPWRSKISSWNGNISEGKGVKLPVFPGTGCPWLTLSDDNKATFEVSVNGITYWFTKSDYDATITIMVSNGGEDYDCYQSISLGMMNLIRTESYMFPLYVAGGNQALSQDIYVHTPINSINSTQKNGNIYDLDIQNICLSNSNLLHPTKFNDANMSNFRILSPEGEWKDIYALEQLATVKPYATCSVVTNWGIVLEEPTVIGGSYHSAFPFMNDSRNKIDVYTVDRKLNHYEHESILDKVVINLTHELPHLETGIEGTLPNCYASWYRTLPVGEIEINGKKCLSIPNGWEERWWHYPWFLGSYNDKQYWENDKIRQQYDKKTNNLFQNKMVHRLIIPLEEGV